MLRRSKLIARLRWLLTHETEATASWSEARPRLKHLRSEVRPRRCVGNASRQAHDRDWGQITACALGDKHWDLGAEPHDCGIKAHQLTWDRAIANFSWGKMEARHRDALMWPWDRGTKTKAEASSPAPSCTNEGEICHGDLTSVTVLLRTVNSFTVTLSCLCNCSKNNADNCWLSYHTSLPCVERYMHTSLKSASWLSAHWFVCEMSSSTNKWRCTLHCYYSGVLTRDGRRRYLLTIAKTHRSPLILDSQAPPSLGPAGRFTVAGEYQQHGDQTQYHITACALCFHRFRISRTFE